MLKPEVELRPHQQNAINRLVQKDGNLLLSHATGSGKTVTAIAGFETLKAKGKANNALIVVPAALRYNFAEQGVEKFTDSPYVIFGNKTENSSSDPRFVDPDLYQSKSKPVNYHIVSYDMFKKDPIKYIDAAKADTLIYDEIHRGKNEATNITKVMKEIRPLHKNFIGLTGSIVSNTPGDIVPLVDAMTGGNHKLGPKAVFNARFLKEDNKGNKFVTNPILVKGLTAPYIDHVEISDLNIAPPPKKLLNTVKVPMGNHQEDTYRYLINQLDPATKLKLHYGLGGKKLKEREMAAIFSKLMTQRQLSNYMKSFNPDISHEQSLAESPKMRRVIADIEEHLRTTPDAQIIVGTQFISAGIEPLEYHLKQRGHDPAIFVGKGNAGVTENSRRQAIEDFKAGKKKILLISSAGGEGLDLPNTTKIIMLDGHYNPEVLKQMEARGIRAGGLSHRDPKDRKVEVTRYVTHPSYRKLDIVNNIRHAINPNTYIDRVLDREPLFQNPINRPLGVDELVDQIATRKDEMNSNLKSMWKKTSAFQVQKGYLYDPKAVSSDYMKSYGPLLEIDAPKGEGGWYNRNDEQRFVDKYRELSWAAGSKLPDKTGRQLLKKSPFKESDFDESGRLKPEALNRHTRSSALKTSIMIPATAAYLALLGLNDGTAKPNAIAGGVIGAGLAGLSTWGIRKSSRDSIYTTVPVSTASKVKALSDEQIRDILRGSVVRQEIIKNVDHYV